MKYISTLISLVFFTLYTCLSAFAGDFAKREIHGFSADGGLFAFEEYGVQDGSGFPYSNIYVVNTATDQWTAGSPFRVRLEDESKTIFDAREEARILAGTVMKSFENRGNVVATNHATELGIDTKRMIANPRLVVPPIDDAIEFRLEEISFSETQTCEAFGVTKGFRLLKIGTRDGDETTILHEDDSIPESRNCPLSYDLADLITHYPQGQSPAFAVLIRMQTVGFEGPDGRYLAVTGRF